jgi:MoxR-like ATPase
MRGRRYVLPEDITDLVPDVLRHRVVLSYEALAEGVSVEALIERILKKVAAPDKPLQHAAS